VTASAECRHIIVFGGAQEPALLLHGIGGVLGVTAMAGVAGNAVLGMDAPLPELDRLAVSNGQSAVAGDADDIIRMSSPAAHGDRNQHNQCQKYTPRVHGVLPVSHE